MLPLTSDTVVLAGETYSISTAEQLKILATKVNEGTTFKENEVVLLQDITLNPYSYQFDYKYGLVFCYDTNSERIYQIGTGLPHIAEDITSVKGRNVIYYGQLYGSTQFMDIGSYENVKVLCGNHEYLTENWTPIGNSSHQFEGVFNGDNHQIQGIFLYYPEKTMQGFFYELGNDAVVENVTIEGVFCTKGESGGIAAKVNGGLVRNCVNHACVIGDDYLGGITGNLSNGIIINCINGLQNSGYGSVTGSYFSGGIAGKTVDSSVYNCHNYAWVYTNNVSEVGGIIGGTVINKTQTETRITVAENCTNYGYVKCGSILHHECVGGIIGSIINESLICRAYISKCNNYGEVSSTVAGTGGIAGYLYYTTVEDCVNYGNVTNRVEDIDLYSAVGGIVGYACHATYILRCMNSSGASVNGTRGYVGGILGISYTGGIFGFSKDQMIENCYNTGRVEGVSCTGGIFGTIMSTGWERSGYHNSYNSGTISGTDNTGSIGGKTEGTASLDTFYALEGCVSAGTGGIGGITFTDTGTIEGNKDGLSIALNQWVLNQTSKEGYSRWTSSTGANSFFIYLVQNLEADVTNAFNHDIITYHLTIQNVSKTVIKDIIIKDKLANGLSFLIGSIKVNGNKKPEDYVTKGVLIHELDEEEAVNVEYQAIVNIEQSIAESLDSFISGASVEYMYDNVEYVQQSNTVQIKNLIIDLKLNKTADVPEAQSGDQITYQVALENHSDVKLEQILVRDALPDGTEYVPDSICIDGQCGIAGSMKDGILIGDLETEAAGAGKNKRIITYAVKVNPDETLYEHTLLQSNVQARFNYTKPDNIVAEEEVDFIDSGIPVIHPSLAVQTVTVAEENNSDMIDCIMTMHNNGDKEINSILFFILVESQKVSLGNLILTSIDGMTEYERWNDVSFNQVMHIVSDKRNMKTLAAGEGVRIRMEINRKSVGTSLSSSVICIRSFYNVLQNDGKIVIRSFTNKIPIN